MRERYLGKEGYEVTLAQDGVDALLRLGKKDFHLIISDINMPNLDGFKFLELILQKGIDAPVIFLTGSADLVDEVKGLELGAVDYIRKPISKQLLLLRIQRVLENRSKENPELLNQTFLPAHSREHAGREG